MAGDDRAGTGGSGDAATLEAIHAGFRQRTADVRARVAHELGLRYGSHPAQAVDLYLPEGRGGAPATLCFLHGGGFRMGSPEHIGFIAEPFVQAGVVFAAIGYRLLPDATFPETAADAAAGLKFVVELLASRGSGPGAVAVAGHSTGAMLAGEVCLRQVWLADVGLAREVVHGAVLVSGNYDYQQLPAGMVDAGSSRYVPDLASAIDTAPPSVVVAFGTAEERPSVIGESRQLVAALEARPVPTVALACEGATHLGILDELAAPGSALVGATLATLGVGSANPPSRPTRATTP